MCVPLLSWKEGGGGLSASLTSPLILSAKNNPLSRSEWFRMTGKWGRGFLYC